MATQTGSIDLTASNGVKLMAEAGFESIEKNYATKAELDVQADRIGMVVANNDASSSLQLTADAMTYIGNNVTIKGTDGTSTVISGGQIQTGSLSIGAFDSAAQSATLNSNISVGGRNLLTGTGDWSDWYNERNGWTFSGEVATSPVKSALQWASLNSVGIPLEDCYDRTFTLSLDYRSDDWSSTTGTPYLYVNVKTQQGSAEMSNRKKYRRIDGSKFVPTTEWQRAVITFTVGSDESWFTWGTAGGTHMAVQVFDYSLNQLQLRHVKLEVGNVATDWTAAPEDTEAYVDESAYLSAKPNLSPYFTSSPYKANDYWLRMDNTSPYTFTDMGDGWVRVQCTNTGSSIIRRDWYPIKCPSVRAGQPYTWLAEVRNNASSSVSSGSDFYLVQTNNLQFWGQKAIKTIEGPSDSSMSVNIGTCGSTYTLRKVQNAETAGDGHWTNNDEANVVGLACWTFRCAANSTIDYEVRLSLYEGEYTGPYKPYSGTQLFATQTDTSNASKTATSYVTEITGQNGIMVHPSTDDDTGVRITSDVDIRQDNVSIANFGALDSNNNPTARVGKVDDYHMSIDQDSLDMYDGTHKIASYSASVSSVDDGGVHNITVSETSIHVEPNPDYVAPSQDDPYAGTYDQPPSAGSLVVRGETRIAETTSADDEYESYIGMLAHSRCVNSDSGNVISAGVSVSTSGVMDSTGVRSTIDSKVSLSGNKLQLSREGKTGSGTSVTLDMYQVMQMLTTASANLTRGSAVSSWSSGTVMRSGKVVTLTINGLKLTSALASGSTSGSITTIPTDYRPSVLQRTTACIGTTGNYANVWFVASTTGNVAMANRSSLQIPTTAEISLQITYIID